jgi:hypothetical protein
VYRKLRVGDVVCGGHEKKCWMTSHAPPMTNMITTHIRDDFQEVAGDKLVRLDRESSSIDLQSSCVRMPEPT